MGPRSDLPPTWGAQLAHAERSLAVRAGGAARDEALRLLAALAREPMGHVLARPTTPMSLREREIFNGWVARRMAGEEIAHITGRLAFMGLELTVASGSPLASSAAQRLVELTLECARMREPGELAAAEIGAGCGAIALALAAFEPRFARVVALDPSPDALRMAIANGVRYQLNLVVDWREGDGPGAIPEPVDLIVCDASASASRAAQFFAEAPARLRPGGALLCALAGVAETEALATLAHALPDARRWTAPAPGGAFIAVAQTPRAPAGQAGDTAFKTEGEIP